MAFSGLEIGKRALLAQRLGLDITSNNISNVNTPGYSRRTPNFAETDPLSRNGNFLGTGILTKNINTFRNQYIDSEIRNTNSTLNGYNIDSDVSQRIEALIAEPSEFGLNEMVTEFFNAMNELTLNPQSIAHRQYLVAHTKSMAERINTVTEKLSDLRRDMLKDIEKNVVNANDLIRDIAALNTQIAISGSGNQQEAQTLIDRRENALEDLSKLMDIKATQESDGTLNVFSNGINLVTKNVPSEIRINQTTNQTTGERTLTLQRYDSEKQSLSTIDFQSGELNSQLKHFNVTLDDVDSSDGFSVLTDLNQFVKQFADSVNGIAVNGYGLNESGATPPGRAIFEPSNGTLNGFNIRVNEEILRDPSLLPLSDSPNEPGNSGIARQIGRIAEDTQFLNNQTPAEYYGGLLGRVGILSSDATRGRDTSTLVYSQLDSQREAAMGVNLDEEAVNLIKFQRAFDAAARIVSTTNEILQSLVNLGR